MRRLPLVARGGQASGRACPRVITCGLISASDATASQNGSHRGGLNRGEISLAEQSEAQKNLQRSLYFRALERGEEVELEPGDD